MLHVASDLIVLVEGLVDVAGQVQDFTLLPFSLNFLRPKQK